MSDYVVAKSGVAWIGYIGLISQADTKLLKVNPTIATGDFKVEIDGGASANLTTLPTVTPAGGSSVKISLSAAEMTGDNIVVTCLDAAGAEWCDQKISIQTCVRGLADLAFPTTTGRSIDVSTGGEVGLDWANIGSPTTTNNLSGTSTKAVEPTVAGRTIDVSAGGEAGVDWANVGSPTTTNNLSGTTVAAVTGAVGSVTGAVGSVTGNVGGNVTGSVGSVASGGITAASVAAGAIVQAVTPATDLGDYAAGDTLNFTFGTDGTLGGTPVISIYKASNQTQVTTGVTLDVDYDGVTGLNHVQIVLTDGFYVVNTDYMGVITTGTVGGVSVAGTTVVTFSIQKKTDKQVGGGGGGGGGATADVNVVSVNSVATTSVTAINANQGTTQPLNFTGTGGSALVKGDTVDIAGTASAGAAGKVALDTAQLVPMRDITAVTAPTVGDALAGALAQAGGDWHISANVLTLLNKDGSTFTTFTLGSFVATPATVPSTRVAT